jgi:hypothetical protein
MDTDQAVAYRAKSVDIARAVFRGMVLVGHRRSIEVGHMFWALPGRGFADGITLKKHDPHFRVINAPRAVELLTLQASGGTPS